ncbi:MAG: TraY domain-containing protein [Clostridiaceae bacterium]|nr:TraY domain-containing protein [Clostridiaceae bacterium]
MNTCSRFGGDTVPTSVRLSEETNQRLDRLVKRTGRSKAFYLRQLIESGLDQLEYEYDILQDVSDYRAGKLETYSIEKVRENYGLED